jgi:L-cysteine:1D-myo-inositol 2-amino-2-deoxy-alpha-D-glucopyranoside ligase
MRLFNTLTQRSEPLEPMGNRVTIYVCGITPYDTTHLGHAFINVVYDTLARYLRWRGLDVRYVQNVTDIDDDMLRKAKELGLAWDELGRQEVARYLADLRALNVRMPDYYVWASRETAKMQELIAALIAKGLAYVRDGWVYYSVERDPGFGVLADAAGYVGYDAWLRTANERGNFPDDPRKRNPLDFVLWQGQQPGEPAWPSPWGPGRPGWHIECSAMSLKYLGAPVDIHGGGADLIFPHHTCEIAQSENATGVRPFVRVWMHCAMVEYASEKMSKSLGNLVRVRELLPEYSADAVRVMLLSHHYRDAWEYTAEDMRASAALAERLRAAASCEPARGDESEWERDAACQQAYLEMVAALEDDFQTPRALAALDRLAAHTLEVRAPAQIATLRELAGVLGLRLGAEADEEDEEELPLLCAAGEAPLLADG